MAAISYSINFGNDGFKGTDITTGTLAPNANDIEVRINTTDQNSVATKVKQIVIALEAFERRVLNDPDNYWGV